MHPLLRNDNDIENSLKTVRMKMILWNFGKFFMLTNYLREYRTVIFGHISELFMIKFSVKYYNKSNIGKKNDSSTMEVYFY